MARWGRGEALVERLLSEGQLQQVQGPAADGEPWLAKARRTHSAAAAVASVDPDSSFVLAYDAARLACTALLAQQGLRPTTTGGHRVVDEVLRAQFGDVFRPYRALRIRRNELEYPAYPGDSAQEQEADGALANAAKLIDSAEKLLPNLSLF
ncbi:hypothetical protein J4573_24255 [Actinomadura barringtoniae]|uniref:HEPN domain-containing protein n=1 Tax=Actinomadura barringtoniae TaxID=1427535 RepID=A0A939TBJ1_9ACTN|nr:hypothetical protein [Actinomadura barringtoniae]MBO2450235.1 hypothetical protein [Actinomadura barringtoniae]